MPITQFTARKKNNENQRLSLQQYCQDVHLLGHGPALKSAATASPGLEWGGVERTPPQTIESQNSQSDLDKLR
jgi:ABC-type transport system involved in cytochrome c biogenesis ATPase subunit